MSGLSRDRFEELALFCAKGDVTAAAFIVQLGRCARLADDICDGDSKAPHRDMALLVAGLAELFSANSFYVRHSAALLPEVIQVVLLWAESEQWATDGLRETRIWAFVERDAIQRISYTVALICGGVSHAQEAIRAIHAATHPDGCETFEQYEAEHGHV